MTQRILLYAIEQDVVIGIGGVLQLATAGSTRPIRTSRAQDDDYDLGPLRSRSSGNRTPS
jgi:hypothetical protein